MGNAACTRGALPYAEENAKINKANRREEKKWREQYRLLLLGTQNGCDGRCVGV